MINQFDPVAMLANSKYNVDYGHDVLGKSEGYMWEANMINDIKGPMSTAGSIMIAYGIGSTDPVSKALLFLAGSAMVFIGNSIQVNPTTGERMMKATDQSVITSALSIVGSVIGGKAGGTILSAAIAGFAGGVVGGGFVYDEEGVSHGWTLSDRGSSANHGEQALLSGLVGAFAGAAGAKLGQMGGFSGEGANSSFTGGEAFRDAFAGSMLKAGISTGIGTAVAYGEYQSWGDNRNLSGFTQMQNAGFGGFLGMLTGAIGGGMVARNGFISALEKSANDNPKMQEMFASRMTNQQISQATGLSVDDIAQMRSDFLDELASNAAKGGADRNHAQSILMAGAMEDERRRQESKGPEMSSKDVVTIAFAALKLQGKVTSPEQWNKMLDMVDPNHTQGDYSRMNLSDAMELIQRMGGSLSEIDPTALNKEFQNQNSYGAMMDQVRMQQALERMQQQQSVPVNSAPESNGSAGWWDRVKGSLSNAWENRGNSNFWTGVATGVVDWYGRTVLIPVTAGLSMFVPSMRDAVSDIVGIPSSDKSTFENGADIGAIAPDVVMAAASLPSLFKGLASGAINMLTAEGGALIRASIGGIARSGVQITKDIPLSGPIIQSAGAMSRAEALAQKLGLNIESPTARQVLNSLDDRAIDFIGKFRKGSIWREFLGELRDATVEEALRYSSKARKLLLDNRFIK